MLLGRSFKTLKIFIGLISFTILLITIAKFIHVYMNSNTYDERAKVASIIPAMTENPEKAIFFHENWSSSKYINKDVLNVRHACAVESAASLNPNSQIYVLLVSSKFWKFGTTAPDEFLKVLRTYKNFHLRYVNSKLYFKDTPVEHNHFTQDFDGLFKFVTLWKYGGTSVSFDTIFVSTIEHIAPNFASTLSNDLMNPKIFNFRNFGIGHALVNYCIKYFHRHNSSRVLTNLVKEICACKQVGSVIGRSCMDFTIFPNTTFTPIGFEHLNLFFEKNAFGIHNFSKTSLTFNLWEEYTKKKILLFDLEVPVLGLAKTFCPKIYNKAKELLNFW